MKVFDFDNTIYDGESLVDFFCFCIRKKKSLIFKIPAVLSAAILYKMNKLSIDDLYAKASKLTSVIIKNKDDINGYVEEFWSNNKKKLKKYMLDKISKEDVIITASPDILINGISSELKTKNIISSILNVDTGKFEFICFRENKVTIFKEKYKDAIIDECYTDSLSDLPLMKLAKRAYLVSKDKIELIDVSKLGN